MIWWLIAILAVLAILTVWGITIVDRSEHLSEQEKAAYDQVRRIIQNSVLRRDVR